MMRSVGNQIARDFVAAIAAGGRPEALPIFEHFEAEIAKAEAAAAPAAERARAIAAAGRFKPTSRGRAA